MKQDPEVAENRSHPVVSSLAFSVMVRSRRLVKWTIRGDHPLETGVKRLFLQPLKLRQPGCSSAELTVHQCFNVYFMDGGSGNY